MFSPEYRRQEAAVRKAVSAWVSENGYERPLPTVTDIAADIGVPEVQLNRFIRSWYDKGVLSWRKELRIEEAKRLLLSLPDVPVSEIGRLVGIEDKSNFRKQFTELVRMSPRAWREEHGL
ncbi:MAG: helix-turn-helix domain-containing protein [Bacteroidales bacterium]|nr:helix-turn-helix domain-containing protein [Bacteroidales bacterium]